MRESFSRFHSFVFLFFLFMLAVDGCSGGSNSGSSTTPDSVPSVPTSVTATAGNGQIVLSWATGSGATSYSIYRATTSKSEGSTAYQSGITGTSYTDTGLTNGTTYYYTVAAVNSAGISAQSTEASATPVAPASAPATPTALTATAGNDQVMLSWAGSANATSYSIYRATASGSEGNTAYQSGITGTSYTDTNLTNGTAYYYTVAAVGSGGTSAQSIETSATPEPGFITAIGTDASRYAPGSTATITVSLGNTSSSSVSGKLSVQLEYLGAVTEILTPQSFTLPAGATQSLTFTWTTPPTDYQGYLIDVTAQDGNSNTLGQSTSALDVSSSWVKFPRYGYLTSNSFGTMTPDAIGIMSQLTRYHINGLQYYDWEWKHHVPLSGTVATPSTLWTNDGSGKTVYAAAIESLISAGHQNNIAAMAYNSIYSALNGSYGTTAYWNDGSGVSTSWGLYTTSAGVNGSKSSFYQWQYMDPSNTNWQQYLLNQQIKVIQAFGFDGFHADSFGDINQVNYTSTGAAAGVSNDSCTTDTSTWGGNSVLNNNAGSENFINGTFTPFLTYAKSALGSYYFVFNPVTYDHAHCEANASPVDFLYSELWPNGDGFITYQNLKDAIDLGREESAAAGNEKPMVAATYVDYNPSAGVGSGFHLPDVLLLDATLFASGGAHIELGDGNRMLNQENFTTNSIGMETDLSTAMTAYYDFLTAYENLLRGGQKNTGQTVSVTGQTVQSSATPNTIWAFSKADDSYEVAHLINLVGQSSIDWQTGACSGCTYTSAHSAPIQMTNLTVKYYAIKTVKSVTFASPDVNGGRSMSLPFTTGSDSGGSYVTFTIPSLLYWDMVYMKVE